VVLGAVALGFLNHWFIPDVLDGEFVKDKLDSLGLEFSFTEVTFGVFGFLLVLMMVLRPEGLLPERRRQIELTSKGEGSLEEPGETHLYEVGTS
jgi:branched-chain amino acid transport system permease protein